MCMCVCILRICSSIIDAYKNFVFDRPLLCNVIKISAYAALVLP